MTKKMAVSVPDDVADRLNAEPNASAYISEAVRRRMAGERTSALLTGLGFNLSEEKLAVARQRRAELLTGITPELQSAAADLYAQIKSGRA